MSSTWKDEWVEQGYVLAFTRLRYHFSGCDEEIRDAVQSAFRRTLAKKKPEDFPDLPHFVRWITTVAKNELIDALRKSGFTPQFANVDAIAVEQLTETSSPGEETLKLLRDCMHELKDELRIVLNLYYFEGLNDENIGKRLNTSPATVWRRRRDALAGLRRRLLMAGLDPVSWDLSPLLPQSNLSPCAESDAL